MSRGASDPAEDRRARLAEEIVDEALDGYRAVLPAALYEAIRDHLLDAFVFEPDARLLLRRALPDPQRAVSGEVEDDASDASGPDDDRERSPRETGRGGRWGEGPMGEGTG